MNNVVLHTADKADLAAILEIDHLKRRELIAKAIDKHECFLICAENAPVGFMIFNYGFFECGFIDLIVIKEGARRSGYGGAAIQAICDICKTPKLFTSTNRSNTPMRNLLIKLGFVYAGTIDGLDDDDPEMFYYKYLVK